MRLLVDTNVFIKVLENAPDLSEKHRQYIANGTNEKWISQIVFMELAIKIKIGKLPNIKVSLEDVLKQSLADGFLHLPISNRHIFTYEHLPLFEDHRDPFDRFIISTAIAENMKIVTTDNKFVRYKEMVDIL